jgi:hypothetical protein
VVARSARQKEPVVFDWCDVDADEVPNPVLPDGQKIARRQRWTRRYVKASVILCPAITLVALASMTATHPSSSVTSLASPGRTAATIAVEQWLAERPSPLPGASILSYDGQSPIATVKAKGEPTPTWHGELESFTLVSHEASADPTTWSVGVEVALDRSGGAVALSGPSFLPAPTASGGTWDEGGPWPGLVATSTVSGSVQTVVNDWLAAYTSGDDAELHLAVGDPNAAHRYVALSNVRSATDTVVAAAPVGKKADELAVEVQLDIVFDGEHQPTTSFGAPAGPSGPATTMDLLVAHASSAAPVVVAWGPPGSGPTLTPYENAIGG